MSTRQYTPTRSGDDHRNSTFPALALAPVIEHGEGCVPFNQFSLTLSLCVCVCVCWQRVDLAKTREAIKSWPKMYKGYVDLAFWLTFVALYCVVLTQQQKVRGLLKTTL